MGVCSLRKGMVYWNGDHCVHSTPDVANVHFLNCGPNDIFRWPQVDDIDDVDAKLVIASDVDMVPLKVRGQAWTVGTFRATWCHCYFLINCFHVCLSILMKNTNLTDDRLRRLPLQRLRV